MHKPSNRRTALNRRQGLAVTLMLGAGALLLALLLGSLAFSVWMQAGMPSPLPLSLRESEMNSPATPALLAPPLSQGERKYPLWRKEARARQLQPARLPAATAIPTATLVPPTATPSSEGTPTFTPSPTPDAQVAALLTGMSLEQKVGQMLMVGVEGHAAGCAYLQEILPGAVVYRGGNIASLEQTRTLSTELQECAGQAGLPPLWIAMDHEGQYVNRLESALTTFPAALAIGAANTPDYAFQAGLAQGGELAYIGVNLALGPVADVLTDYDNAVISLRSYGGDPARAAEMVRQAVAGYQQAGLAAALKHFPGHGGVAGDLHALLPVDSIDLPGWQQIYRPVFQAGIEAGAPVVMLGHLAFPALDPSGLPATLSPAMIRILRDEMGFQGVILTDLMGMGAIKQTWTVGEAGLLAVQAGVDMLLTTSPETTRAVRSRLLQAAASGELPAGRLDEAVRRILAAKLRQGWRGLAANGPEPDWAANRSLARQIGYAAPLVLRNQAGLLPLPQNVRQIVAYAPSGGWGLEYVLQQALEAQGKTLRFIHYPAPWGEAVEARQADSLAAQAGGYDLALVFTWDAHLEAVVEGSRLQARLVRKLLNSGLPVAVAALKSPADILEFPQIQTYLASFGTTPGQVQALVDLLVFNAPGAAQNPLPGLLEP